MEHGIYKSGQYLYGMYRYRLKKNKSICRRKEHCFENNTQEHGIFVCILTKSCYNKLR